MGPKLPTLCRIVRLAVCLALVGAGSATAEARIYKYVDRDGVSHFSDSFSSIPDEYRDQMREVSDELAHMDRFQVTGGDGSSEKWDPGAALLDLAALDLDQGDRATEMLRQLGFVPLLLFSFCMLVLVLLSAGILKLACRLAGEAPPGMGRACGVLLAQILAGFVVGAAVGSGAAWLGIGESVSILASVAVGSASTVLSWAANAGILTAATGYGFLTCLWVGVLNFLLMLVIVGGPVAVAAVIVLVVA